MGTAAPDHAIDVVFLPEGYRAEDLDAFRHHVDDLVSGVMADAHGIVAMAPGLFDFHRVDLPSNGTDVTDADRHDTALAGCLEEDPLHFSKTPFLAVDEGAAWFAARRSVGRVDVAVVVMNTSSGRGNAAFPGNGPDVPVVIKLNRDDDDRVLTHELGHALVGLDDEYADTDACFPSRPVADATADVVLIDRPNLTTDASGARWSGLVQGAVPNGQRYGACIFHPADDCRMRDTHADDFCPVCKNEIRDMLASRVGTSSRRPACAIELSQRRDRVSGHLLATAHAFSRNPPVTFAFTVGGSAHPPVVSAEVWHAVADLSIMPYVLPATIELRCTDAAGNSSAAAIDARATCTAAETAACPALHCRCAGGSESELYASCEDHVCKSDRDACEAACNGPVDSIERLFSALGTPECDALCAAIAACGSPFACAYQDNWCMGQGTACREQTTATLRCWSESTLTCSARSMSMGNDAASCALVASACSP
jgi:hypothetical protein